MKKIITTIALVIGLSSVAQANCLDNIGDYAKSDSMIKAWGTETSTGNTIVFIQNIRNMQTIDITNYGFNDSMAKEMESAFGCQNVKFENAYTDLGIKRY